MHHVTLYGYRYLLVLQYNVFFLLLIKNTRGDIGHWDTIIIYKIHGKLNSNGIKLNLCTFVLRFFFIYLPSLF